jgi:ribonuclease P protein component
VRYTYQHGKTIRHPKISLVYCVNSKNKKRFAVVVSKKVLKNAVGRNRIRRRVYELIRAELPNIKKPVDCIFVIYGREVYDMPFLELKKLVKGLLTEATII